MKLEPSEIVSEIAGTFTNLNQEGKLLKPHSALPCNWYEARNCFMTSFRKEHQSITEVQNSAYHYIYSELSFFIEDEVIPLCEKSIEIAIDSYVAKVSSVPISRNDARNLLFGTTGVIAYRENLGDIFEECIPNCPIEDRKRLVEVFGYCGKLYRLMWDEWAIFVNYIAFLDSVNGDNK